MLSNLSLLFTLSLLSVLSYTVASAPAAAPRGGANVVGVQYITPENYDDSLYRTEGDWLIMFSQPWCGQCNELVPVFNELATDPTMFEGIVNIGIVDCSKYQGMCTGFQVKHYPTVLLIRNKMIYEMPDPEDISSFLQFIRIPTSEFDALPEPDADESLVVPMGLKNFTQTLQNDTVKGWFVKFFKYNSIESFEFGAKYKALARRLSRDPSPNITCGEVDCNAEKALCKEFEITDVPAIIFVSEGNFWKYYGSKKVGAMIRWANSKLYSPSNATTLPSFYGEYHERMQIARSYWKGFEKLVITYLWQSMAAVFLYGMFLGAVIVGAPIKQQQQQKGQQQTQQQPQQKKQDTQQQQQQTQLKKRTKKNE